MWLDTVKVHDSVLARSLTEQLFTSLTHCWMNGWQLSVACPVTNKLANEQAVSHSDPLLCLPFFLKTMFSCIHLWLFVVLSVIWHHGLADTVSSDVVFFCLKLSHFVKLSHFKATLWSLPTYATEREGVERIVHHDVVDRHATARRLRNHFFYCLWETWEEIVVRRARGTLLTLKAT